MTRRKSAAAKATDAIEEIADGLQAVMREAGVSEGTATVYRKTTGGEEEYLDRIGVDDVKTDILETLKARWGGGRFRIVLKNAEGAYVKGGSLNFVVAGVPRDDKIPDRFEQLEAKWAERIEKAKSSGTGSGEVMLLMFQQMSEQIRELRNPPAAAQGANPVELAVALATSMQAATAPLLAALVERSNEPQKDPMEMVTGLLGMAMQLKDLGGDGGSGMDKVVGQLAAPLGRFFDSQAAGAQQPPARAAAPTQPPPSSNGAPAMADAPPWYGLLKRAIPQLLEWANAGKSAELRADVVLEELPDRYLGPIHEQLRRGPEFLIEFLRVVPEAQDTREWFGLFFARMLEGLEDMWETEESEPAAELGGGEDELAQEEEGEPERTPGVVAVPPGAADVDAEPAG